MSEEIRATLDQRGVNYGKFMDNAVISEALMDIIRAAPGYANFEPDQRVATWVIIQKLARALSGNAQYDDNWRDIAGYAQLIVDRINGTGIYAEPTATLNGADLSGGTLSGADLRREQLRVVDVQDGLEQTVNKPSRCIDCYAVLGDAHAPDCPQIRR